MTNVMSICPGCGLVLPSPYGLMDTQFNASWACRELSGEASAYTLTLGDPEFSHQLMVDAYCAQHAGPMVKPIGPAFALIGLLLTFERGYTGRQVQRAHMHLAKKSKVWPRFDPPQEKGSLVAGTLTVRDVIEAAAGSERDEMLRQWGKSVWEMWRPEHERVRELWERYA